MCRRARRVHTSRSRRRSVPSAFNTEGVSARHYEVQKGQGPSCCARLNGFPPTSPFHMARHRSRRHSFRLHTYRHLASASNPPLTDRHQGSVPSGRYKDKFINHRRFARSDVGVQAAKRDSGDANAGELQATFARSEISIEQMWIRGHL